MTSQESRSKTRTVTYRWQWLDGSEYVFSGGSGDGHPLIDPRRKRRHDDAQLSGRSARQRARRTRQNAALYLRAPVAAAAHVIECSHADRNRYTGRTRQLQAR